MDENYIKKSISLLILLILLVLSFFLVRPILLSIIFGGILAFIFYPLYRWINRKLGWKNVSALLSCILLLILIVLPIWTVTPLLIDQSVKIYISAQQVDFITPIETMFPGAFLSETASAEAELIIQSFLSKVTNSLMGSISNFILNLPVFFLHLIVVFFTFFFILRDKDELVKYVNSLMPFTKEVQKKLFNSSKAITTSVLYGQVVIGIIQGIVLGIGLIIFGVPNALFYTLLAVFAGVFPVVGTAIVWFPILIYLMIAGTTVQVIGILIFGIISSSLDNFIRPVIVSKMTKTNSSIVLVGMLGGLFMFGILGLILGPLILAYTLILLEFYRKRPGPNILSESK